MTIPTCPHESAVGEALISGRLTDELRAHAESCPVCADVALVAVALQQHARLGVDEDAESLPDPGLIWWRAQLQSRCVASERLSRMLRLSWAVAGGAAATVAVLLLPQLRPALAGWLSGFASLASSTASAAGAANPILVLAVSAAMLLLLAASDVQLGGAGKQGREREARG